MPETTSISLGPKAALSWDEQQWMLQVPSGTTGRWKSVAFVSSTKAILFRVIREREMELSDEGRAALAGLPETFREFKQS